MYQSRKERLNKLKYSLDRGYYVLNILKQYHHDTQNKILIDAGCGFGNLAVVFAKHFKKVYAIDIGKEQIESTLALKRKFNLRNLYVYQGNLLELSSIVDEKVDIVHTSGVFEWLRLANTEQSAKTNQEKFLREVTKVIRNENSILYVGTENRLFPYFWIKDPHYKGYPFLTILPEKINDIILNIIKKEKYPVKIYSYWGLKSLLSHFFDTVHTYVALPHYQYVYEYSSIDDYKNIVNKSWKLIKYRNDLNYLQEATLYCFLIIGALKLTKIFSPNFIMIASKRKLRD